ncbi:hypothetical protein TL16_g11090 [Triparma laevis f. inornata]|uniref:Exonuclease domain-containing protein n=1 Tax=Triparma laevis f. inornata TaxID=1714386 RepID=A0A9W7BC11_9STRA|nr:hypothetical protein TL16_g11090 [Triparma laevis f. inornata]
MDSATTYDDLGEPIDQMADLADSEPKSSPSPSSSSFDGDGSAPPSGKKLKKLLKSLNNSMGLTTQAAYERLVLHPDHAHTPVLVTPSLDISSSQAKNKSAKEKLSSRALRPLVKSLPSQSLPPNPFFSVRNIGGLKQTNLIFLDTPSHLPSPVEADSSFNESYDSISYRIKHDGVDVKMTALKSRPEFSVDGDNSKINFGELVLSEDELNDNLYPSKGTHPSYRTFGEGESGSNKNALPKIYAIDCEMVQTTEGSELARCTITELGGKTIYDRYVKPSNVITDYLTLYSGISEKTWTSQEYTTLEEFQSEVYKIVNSEDVVVGHSLENDLHAMKIVHLNCIDTAVLFKDNDDGRKHSLKYLIKGFFGRDIQRAEHDSGEDARAAMDLAILKARYGKKVGMKGGRMCTEMEDWVFDRDEMIGCWGGEMSRFLKGSVWSSGVSGRERVTVGGGYWSHVTAFLKKKTTHRSLTIIITDRSKKYREMTEGRNVRRRGAGVSPWKEEDEQEWKREKERARMGEVYFVARKAKGGGGKGKGEDGVNKPAQKKQKRT